jgi:hypothetical protein
VDLVPVVLHALAARARHLVRDVILTAAHQHGVRIKHDRARLRELENLADRPQPPR